MATCVRRQMEAKLGRENSIHGQSRTAQEQVFPWIGEAILQEHGSNYIYASDPILVAGIILASGPSLVSGLMLQSDNGEETTGKAMLQLEAAAKALLFSAEGAPSE
jgi:hypothetical protein